MEPLRIDHVGIAVNSLDEMRPFYEALGLKSTGIEEVKEQQVRVEFYPCGDSELELLESTTEDGPIAKFIEKKGTGIQHIAIRVPDIKAAIAEMQEKGYITLVSGVAILNKNQDGSTIAKDYSLTDERLSMMDAKRRIGALAVLSP